MLDASAWFQATWPPGADAIVVPLLLGLALALASLGRFGLSLMCLAGLFGLLVRRRELVCPPFAQDTVEAGGAVASGAAVVRVEVGASRPGSSTPRSHGRRGVG